VNDSVIIRYASDKHWESLYDISVMIEFVKALNFQVVEEKNETIQEEVKEQGYIHTNIYGKSMEVDDKCLIFRKIGVINNEVMCFVGGCD